MPPEMINYLSKGLSPLNFMRYCKDHEDYFINYFEVIIAKDGTTYFAAPSHIEKVKRLSKEQYGVDFRRAPYRYESTGFLVSKFGYAMTHYSQIECASSLTKAQKRALKIYVNSGLISSKANVIYNYDYEKYQIALNLPSDQEEVTRIYEEFNKSYKEPDVLFKVLGSKE